MPKVTEINVSYSVGMKTQIVKYELSADFHLSESHKIDVTGMSPEDIVALADSERAEIAIRLGDDIMDRVIKAQNQESI
jgi:hypothetical protein